MGQKFDRINSDRRGDPHRAPCAPEHTMFFNLVQQRTARYLAFVPHMPEEKSKVERRGC